MPVVIGLATVAGALLHHLSPLPSSYTWTFTLEMFRDVLLEPWFPTLAAVCFAAGRLTRRRATADALSRSATRRVLEERVSIGWLAGLAGAVAVAAIALVFPGHMPSDWAAIGLMAAWLVLLPPSRATLRAFVVQLIVIFVLYTLSSYAHTVGKALIFVGAEPQDDLLLAVESAWFGEPLHRPLAAYAAEHAWFLHAASAIYRWNASQILLASIVLIGVGASRERTELLSSVGLALILAAPLYHVVPSMGPVFAEPRVFSFLADANISANWYDWLRLNTQQVIEGRARELSTFQYIAAMPSLHVGFSVTLLYYVRRVPFAFVPGLPITIFAWASTMILGWHYFIDGVFGTIVAFAAVAIVQRAQSWLLPAGIMPPAGSVRT
jgi:hypothetical protein